MEKDQTAINPDEPPEYVKPKPKNPPQTIGDFYLYKTDKDGNHWYLQHGSSAYYPFKLGKDGKLESKDPNTSTMFKPFVEFFQGIGELIDLYGETMKGDDPNPPTFYNTLPSDPDGYKGPTPPPP